MAAFPKELLCELLGCCAEALSTKPGMSTDHCKGALTALVSKQLVLNLDQQTYLHKVLMPSSSSEVQDWTKRPRKLYVPRVVKELHLLCKQASVLHVCVYIPTQIQIYESF